MPELPDVALYVTALQSRLIGEMLLDIRLRSPFLVRSYEPPLESAVGRVVRGVRRLGKRVVLELEDELFLVLHLMIAGRLHWRKAGAGLPGRSGLIAFDFEHGSLTLTEAGTKRRAALHVVRGEVALAGHDPGGVEPFDVTLADFRALLESSHHTLKRTLCDPSIFSGIGNAYSDEILHAARLSPFKRSGKLDESESERLWMSMRSVLQRWIELLSKELGDGFPEKVTAFRPDMAVHGRYQEPCPICAASVRRIVYADSETNYCAACQTNGKILKDRALSRLLKDDWPRSLDEFGDA